MSESLLSLIGVDRNFGGVQAVSQLSFEIHPGEIIGLIGPNGSGKSTSVNLISGALPVSAGSIEFAGRAINALSQSERVGLGMARTFQTTSVFPEFTALEQALTACHSKFLANPWEAVFRQPRGMQEELRQYRKAQEILHFVGLGSVAEHPCGTLSSAQQRLLMIATALASEPRLVLLDEPAAGMVASERKDLAGLIRRICDQGIAVLVIEHHMGLIMEVCERIVVLNFGRKIAEGTPLEIQTNPEVIQAYLGGAVDA
jgi:ABC-type branched-subunit amino acid transport system ATPase component